MKNVNTKSNPALSIAYTSGFTLIEAVIYLALFSMIAVTLVSLAYASAQEDQSTTSGVINAYENN